jgi:hypothetical protein
MRELPKIVKGSFLPAGEARREVAPRLIFWSLGQKGMTFATSRFGIAALILASGLAHAQALNTQQETADIKHMIASSAPPAAAQIAMLHRMGDAAARSVTELLRGRAPLSATEQRNVVDIVHRSFEAPAAIALPTDRKPSSSLALLNRIAAGLQDPSLQPRLLETQQFLASAAQAK